MRRSRGFTLIELMIVIAILGILLAIAIPAYQDYTVRTRVSEGLNLAAGLKPHIVEYFHATGNLPADNSSAGASPPASYVTDYVSRIDVGSPTDGVITITYDTSGTGIPELGGGNVLSIVPVTSLGVVDWNCGIGYGSTNVAPQYLPPECR